MTDKLKFGQEIIQIGGSLGILIPYYFIKSTSIKKGDIVEVTVKQVKT